MTYVKIEDDIFRHPKMIEVSSGAKLLYIASICYSGSSLTDGYIPRNAPSIFGAEAGITNTSRAVKELVDAGLWDATERGYQVHDYLDFNESAEKVEAKRKAARDRMRGKRAENDPESSDDVRANTSRTGEEVSEPTTTTTGFSNEKHGEGANAPPDPKPKTKRATQVPDDFPITDQLEAWGRDNGFSRRQLESQVPLFQDHYRARGETRKDWVASFRTWMHKARNWSQLPDDRQPEPPGEFLGTDGLKALREQRRRAQEARP